MLETFHVSFETNFEYMEERFQDFFERKLKSIYTYMFKVYFYQRIFLETLKILFLKVSLDNAN